jgi:hypothetical protein
MNGDFQPDAFTTRETEIQSRITAARQAAGRAFDASGVFLEVRSEETFKQFVITALQTLIRTERDNETEFRNNIDQLGRFLQTLKTDDGTRANSVLEGGGLMNEDLWIEIGNYELNRGYVGYIGGIEKLGIYLELQFAEAFKDIAKASRNSRQEVLTQSTLIDGGDRLGLVYKPDGFLDQGWNHIRGLSNADLWYEGSANWARVADALRSALR